MKASALKPAAVPLRAVYFDLDGTLVDSAPDIGVAVCELMNAYGLAPHSLQAVRQMIGEGVEMLVARAFAAHGVVLTQSDLSERCTRMAGIYAENLTRLTTLRAGAAEAISATRRAGLRAGVVTNKGERFARIVLEHFELLQPLDFVIGGDSGYSKKPAADMLLAACKASDCRPEEAILVGDSPADAAAAKAAGMRCAIVRGGYARVPVETLDVNYVLDSLEEIASVLLPLCGNVQF